MKIAIRAGHNHQATGAVGIINEVTENRILLPLVINYLREYGHEVLDVTPGNCDTNEDLMYGVNKANEWGADVFASLHFNKAYNSYDGVIGSEVCVYSHFDAAQMVCDNLEALGFVNRGQKVRKELHELRNTTMSAMVIETCFLEATGDVELYRNLGAEKVAKAIALGILNKEYEESGYWSHNGIGWSYYFNDGTYAKNQWLQLDAWYLFDERGYAYQNEFHIDDRKRLFYFKDDCRCVNPGETIILKADEYCALSVQ